MRLGDVQSWIVLSVCFCSALSGGILQLDFFTAYYNIHISQTICCCFKEFLFLFAWYSLTVSGTDSILA
jgi:hypothetical protein